MSANSGDLELLSQKAAEMFGAALRDIPYYIVPKRLPRLRNYFHKELYKCSQDGWLDVLGSPENPQAVFAYTEGMNEILQLETGNLVVAYELGNGQAQHFILENLRAHFAKFHPYTSLNIPATYHGIFDPLYEIGFSITAFESFGCAAIGQKAFAELNPELHLQNLGIEIRDIDSPELVDAIIEMKCEYFGAHPEYCWFYTKGGFSKTDRNRMIELMKSGDTFRKALFDSEGLAGTFSYDHIPNDYCVGLDFTFHPRIQNRGVGKAAYRLMFEEMLKNKIEYYRGSTSNPAVMHLREGLGRKITTFHFMKGKSHFPRDYFPKL